VETIDLDKSDSIPTKRSLKDEDVTCELCSQAFWYKSQLYEHLQKEHDIYGETEQSKTLNYSMLHYKNGSLFCRSCSKCFKSRSDILSHIRICFFMKSKVPNDGEKRNTKTTKEIVVLDEEIGQLEKSAGSHKDSVEDTGDIEVISDEDNEISDEESETSDEESEISDEVINTSDEEKVIWNFPEEESDEELEQENCSAKPKCLKPVGKQVHIFMVFRTILNS
jgi:hypothetical protein